MGTQSTVYNLGMWSDSNSFHSNLFQLPTATLKTLEEDPDKFNKISYQIPQDHQETKDLKSKPNSSASSPWRRSLSVPDHVCPWHWHRLQPPQAQTPWRHGRVSLPSGGVSHLGEPRRSSVGRLRRLLWRRSGSLGILAVVAGSKGWKKNGIVIKRFCRISSARFCQIAYGKLSLQLWSMVNMVECGWWKSNTSVEESVWRFSRTFQPFPRCITVFCNVPQALILVLHGCQVCQISLWELKAPFTI